MTYEVTIAQRQQHLGTITVEADTNKQAKELVQSMIEDGEIDSDRITWDDPELHEMRVAGSCQIEEVGE
jgi:hypothetical protein